MPCPEFSNSERVALLDIARLSVAYGLETHKPGDSLPAVSSAMENPKLAAPRASFVTLTKNGMLRGCIGSLEARQPLALDVARNAFNAAFQDPRFPSLEQTEFDEIHIEVAILTPQTLITVSSESELLAALNPHEDGLTIDDGRHRATFLPKVWESLPEPRRFLSELKRKAGLPADYWSDDIKAYRYHSESFAEGAV